jgi:HAD superfamily hydrolase (TIGR01509 family)
MAYRFDMAGHVPLRAAIFDVDGVLVDSPHEQAWRETLDRLMAGPWAQLALDIGYQHGSLTTERYQRAIAGRPRLDGARGGLEAVGVAEPDDEHVHAYAAAKQSRLVDLIEHEPPPPFDDAVTLLIGLRELGLAVATASASKNASRLLAAISLPDGRLLSDLLDADVSGLDAPGKPDPAIFVAAAHRLGRSPEQCFVVEDSPAGAEAARRGGMSCVGVDRGGVADELRASGADIVLDRLDRIQPAELLGRLEGRS